MKIFARVFVKIHLSFLLGLISFSSLTSQTMVVDSLMEALQQADTDTARINLLLELSWNYHNSKPQQTVDYAQRAYDIASAVSYERGKMKALNLIGIGLDAQGELDDALSYYEAALHQAEALKDSGKIWGYLNNVGLINERKGYYSKAMEYYHRSLSMIDENEHPEHISILLNNIGLIYDHLKEYPKALEYLERSLAIERQINNQLGITMALSNIGETYKNMGELDKAEIYFNDALKISERIEDKVGISSVLCNLGEVQLKKGLFENAANYFPRSLELAREIGDKSMEAHALTCLGKVNSKQGKFQASIFSCLESLEIAKEMGAKKLIVDNYETLSESYSELGNFKRAFEYKQLQTEGKDELYSEEKSRQILDLSTQYETKKKETENALLKEQQAKNEAIIQRRTIIGWGVALILALMSLIAFILFNSNRQKQAYSQQLEMEVSRRTEELKQSNEKLVKSNKELERFAYIASHDLKEPLRNIVSFTRLIERRLPESADKSIRDYMSFVINNSRQMHLLIEDVLEFSRIDSLRAKEDSTADLNEVVAMVCGVLGSTLTEENVELDIGILPKVNAHSSHLFLVFKNLLENGIKYNQSSHPIIKISCEQVGDFHQITVTDNGIGIDPQYSEQIFGMFKRLHNREEYQGSGLGLSICRKVINTYGGQIWVESEIGAGSRFTFSLPVSPPVSKNEKNKSEVAEEVIG